MKKDTTLPFQKRILLSILLPVLAVGVIFCMVSTRLITPPILEVIQTRIDSELKYASNMALQICETHLNYLLDLRLEDDREMNAALKMEAMGNGESILSDIPFVCSDGSIIYLDFKTTPVTFDGVSCNLGFFTDVTTRRAAAVEHQALVNRLHRSEKMEALGLLAGGVAHDLNNILSGLVSYPELLLEVSYPCPHVTSTWTAPSGATTRSRRATILC